MLSCALMLSLVLSAPPPAHAEEPATAGDKDNFSDMREYDNAFFVKKKDPIFSGMLSWYMPGLGQFYSGRLLKGSIFLVTEYALTIGAIFYFLDFDFAAGSDSGFNVKVDAKRTDLGLVETSRRNVFIGILTMVFVIHLYNVTDAVLSARNFNIEIEESRRKLREKMPNLNLSYEGKRGVYLGMQTSF